MGLDWKYLAERNVEATQYLLSGAADLESIRRAGYLFGLAAKKYLRAAEGQTDPELQMQLREAAAEASKASKKQQMRVTMLTHLLEQALPISPFKLH